MTAGSDAGDDRLHPGEGRVHAVGLDHPRLPRRPVEEEGVERRAVPRGEVAVDRLEPRDVGRVEIGRGAHPGQHDLDLAPLEFSQDRIEIGPRQPRVERAQHVVGAKLDDHQVGLARQPVERPAEPRAPRLAGIPRDAAIDHRRGDAVTAQARLQLRREAEPAIERIAGGQAVAEREDQRARRRRGGAGAALIAKAASRIDQRVMRARCGAIVAGRQAS